MSIQIKNYEKILKKKIFFSENDDFIDDKYIEGDTTQSNFCRFINQTRDPQEALNCDDQFHVHDHLHPEMYICKPRQNVEFNKFDDSVKLLEKPKKTLRSFENVDKDDSLFFVAILFGLLIKISDNGSVDEQPAAEFLDQEF